MCYVMMCLVWRNGAYSIVCVHMVCCVWDDVCTCVVWAVYGEYGAYIYMYACV